MTIDQTYISALSMIEILKSIDNWKQFFPESSTPVCNMFEVNTNSMTVHYRPVYPPKYFAEKAVKTKVKRLQEYAEAKKESFSKESKAINSCLKNIKKNLYAIQEVFSMESVCGNDCINNNKNTNLSSLDWYLPTFSTLPNIKLACLCCQLSYKKQLEVLPKMGYAKYVPEVKIGIIMTMEEDYVEIKPPSILEYFKKNSELESFIEKKYPLVNIFAHRVIPVPGTGYYITLNRGKSYEFYASLKLLQKAISKSTGFKNCKEAFEFLKNPLHQLKNILSRFPQYFNKDSNYFSAMSKFASKEVLNKITLLSKSFQSAFQLTIYYLDSIVLTKQTVELFMTLGETFKRANLYELNMLDCDRYDNRYERMLFQIQNILCFLEISEKV